MKLTRWIKRVLKPLAEQIVSAVAGRVSTRMVMQDSGVRFDLTLFAALRNLAARGDHERVLPYESARPPRAMKELKIGLFGNIANNAYNFTRCLRRLGYDAELVVEDGCFDAFLMNRPFWEDVEVTCRSYDEGLAREQAWKQPPYVSHVAYDPGLQQQFQTRYTAIPEVQALYKTAFGLELPLDTAFILAQQMGHWPYLLAMGRFDVIQLSGAAISMGLFCPKPYLVFPTGSDLFISPFEEDVFGLLMRAGYRRARHILVCETNYPEYLERLEVLGGQTFAPMMIDTDTYAPGRREEVRARWIQESGGERFILGVCRQAWEWKGNDRLIRGFHAFVSRPENRRWRLVLMAWGPDVARTQDLINELSLGSYVIWQHLASKPLLRKYQQAADLVADQLVMAGYGTSVLESMAAGRAVVMRPADEQGRRYLPELPPFLGATEPDEVCARLEEASSDSARERAGFSSLEWLRQHHGYPSVAERYLQGYQSAVSRTLTVNR